MYNFIECNESVKFENDFDRKFDLIWQSFPPQSLSDKKDSSLGAIF